MHRVCPTRGPRASSRPTATGGSGFVRLAFLLTGDREVAEELVQDAFLAASRSWATVLDEPAYLRSAVVNRARSWGRRAQLERRQPLRRATPVHLEADELWDALGSLTPRQRAAVVLRYYEDLPEAEIAAILHTRPSTVRTSVHRALRTLRKEITR